MNLLDMVRDAGVVGAGGAGFPTYKKLDAEAEYILLNGAECEPLLRVDQQLMEIYPDEIIKGFEMAGRFVGARKALIGIKEKHREVISILKKRIQALEVSDFMDVRELKDVYPAGDEQVLVYDITGRIVPEAGIPLDVGCVVINSETALNIYYASQKVPVTETYITVAGDVPERLTLKVPVGTPIMDVLKQSGIEDFNEYAVVDGGPLMGSVLDHLQGYVTKTTKGFIVLNKQHTIIQRKSLPMDQTMRINKICTQCRLCTDMCPRYLLGHDMQPHKIMRVTNYQMDNLEEKKIASLCSQCNLCELFSCPIGIYPAHANLHMKQQLAESGMRYERKKTEYQVRENRTSRLVPSKRLIARLALTEFDKPAPMTEVEVTPTTVYIAKKQHVGAPAIPVVAVGDKVEAGQIIGKIPDNSLGATIHASISGTIIETDADFIAVRRD
ncbi:electron transport complex protein RnfC [Oceanobacillus halophilus]|uniref:Electron transport complex protein RnfC n=1 Tax=Oceanobacillus halophilus TaxID=930130 RepID=A0A494ZWM2_9BACI|nr:electron transport complex protein RnfC [Oceanobacillus halophilus]